jgi:type III restriction enzyme
MNDRFFSQPILNSPYEYLTEHWELGPDGQPTQEILEYRRRADFITPIPKPRKRKRTSKQLEMVLDEVKGLSTNDPQYNLTGNINLV